MKSIEPTWNKKRLHKPLNLIVWGLKKIQKSRSCRMEMITCMKRTQCTKMIKSFSHTLSHQHSN